MNGNTIPIRAARGNDRFGLYALMGILTALLLVWTLAAGIGLLTAGLGAPSPAREERARLARLRPGEDLNVEVVARGHARFLATCAACHGVDAQGLPKQGKTLVNSQFAMALSDQELLAFIKKGRPAGDPANTTKVDMPPKGGNADLSDEELNNVIAFVRSVQRPDRVSAPALALAENRLHQEEARVDAERSAARAARLALKAAEKAEQAAAAGGTANTDAEDEPDAETIAFGGELFIATCSTCHGKDAKGLPNNGKDLVHSKFCKSLKDEDLIAFIKQGRGPGDPLNTTKIQMPPKGGNPALNDEKLEAIVAYVRTLQKAATE